MNMKINKKKFEIFLEIAKNLNHFLDITPIVYGSLGLYRIIGERGKCEDIDILIPNEFINEKWNELVSVMEKIGFKLGNEHKHEFIRDLGTIAFLEQNDLIRRINLYPDSLTVHSINDIKFKELSIENYLAAYKFMVQDEYRQQEKKKSDQEKVNLIEKYIHNTQAKLERK